MTLDVEKMEAGGPMDIIVAKCVMGKTGFIPYLLHAIGWAPKYSTDISAAWQVLEHLWPTCQARSVKIKYRTELYQDPRLMKYEGAEHLYPHAPHGTAPTKETPYGCAYGEASTFVWASTAPLAICRGALLFVENENATH